MNQTVAKVAASVAVWFVVFLVLVFGGFTFSPSEDWVRTTLGGLLLAVAAVLSALICSSRLGCRTTRDPSDRSNVSQ
jgi:apolipoprotein N-acyltransferase